MNILSPQTTYWAIVPAAGIGRRLSADKPKQYIELCRKPVIAHTISCLTEHPHIRKTVVVVAADDPYWPAIQTAFSSEKIMTTVGREERCMSVYQGLLALQGLAKSDDWILVHDAVRPCISHVEINRLMHTLNNHQVGGLLGIRVRDTLKHSDMNGSVLNTLDRTHIWQAQTPQMFRYGLLCHALCRAIEKNQYVTDEASAIEQIGKQPLMVEGSVYNIKITYPEDLQSATQYIKSLLV